MCVAVSPELFSIIVIVIGPSGYVKFKLTMHLAEECLHLKVELF